MRSLYDKSTLESSKVITNLYSTSFSLGIKMLDSKFHDSIYAIYGFVRYADEIVDTFHEHDKERLLNEFKADTYKAIEEGLSLNPVLHAFQLVVNKYGINHSYIEAFLKSMEMDLSKKHYDHSRYQEYIFGSAEVVGLMCLKVFCQGDQKQFDALEPAALKLGSAFQKVNFLRDMKSDFDERGRVYFPDVDFAMFTNDAKKKIEQDIQEDFNEAYEGIKNLPKGSRFGVYVAYVYYLALFKKIKNSGAKKIKNERIRVPNGIKILLLIRSYFEARLNFI